MNTASTIRLQSPRLFLASAAFWLAALMNLAAPQAAAQTVLANLPVGNGPGAIALNPATNKAYVLNTSDNTVTVISGTTGAVTATLSVGRLPKALAINSSTNRIYVANLTDHTVSVIDGTTDTVLPSTIPVGSLPYDVAVNPVTNRVYVSNRGESSVTVIDGAAGIVLTTLTTAGLPYRLAVNPVTNKVYVAMINANSVAVIDGATNSVTGSISLGSYVAVFLAVNPVTNSLYMTTYSPGQSDAVLVASGATNQVTATMPIPRGSLLPSLALNTLTNKIYAITFSEISGQAMVIDGATNSSALFNLGAAPSTVALNEATNQVYITIPSIIVAIGTAQTGSLAILDGASNNISNLTSGFANLALGPLAVNPVTNQVFTIAATTAGSGFTASPMISIVDPGGFTQSQTLNLGSQTSNGPIVVDPTANKIYMSDGVNLLYTIDGPTFTSTTPPISIASGLAMVLNPATQKIYAIDGGSTLALIDPGTGAVQRVTVGTSPRGLDVNPVTNKVYVSNFGSNTVSVVDGATGAIKATVAVGNRPSGIAVDPVTNTIYVANVLDSTVSVINGATDTVQGQPLPVLAQPRFVAVNSATNKVYVASGNAASLSVIDGATNAINTALLSDTADALAVNPANNKIYVGGVQNGQLFVVDGVTNNVTTLQLFTQSVILAVNTATGQVVASDARTHIVLIDGNSNQVEANFSVSAGALAVNPVTRQIYSSIGSIDGLHLFDRGPAATLPPTLTTTIVPLPNNETNSSTPSFTFTAASTTVDVPYTVFYQVDTQLGTWRAATGANPSFTATLPPLSNGFHYLYAYAANGEDSTAIQRGSPAIGAIAIYGFLVLPPAQSITFGPIPQQYVGTPLTLTATASSGLTIAYNSTTPSVCTVSGSTATFLTGGSCSIVAAQPGDGVNWAAAAAVRQSFNVVLRAPQVTGTFESDNVTSLSNKIYSAGFLAVNVNFNTDVANATDSGNYLVLTRTDGLNPQTTNYSAVASGDTIVVPSAILYSAPAPSHNQVQFTGAADTRFKVLVCAVNRTNTVNSLKSVAGGLALASDYTAGPSFGTTPILAVSSVAQNVSAGTPIVEGAVIGTGPSALFINTNAAPGSASVSRSSVLLFSGTLASPSCSSSGTLVGGTVAANSAGIVFTPAAALPNGSYHLVVCGTVLGGHGAPLGSTLTGGIPGAGVDFVRNFSVAVPQNVTGQVSVTSSGLVYNRTTKTGSQTLTVKNTGSAAILGPVEVALSLGNAAVTGSTNAGTFQGNPWWLVSNTSIAPGASVAVTVTFSYAAGTNFNAVAFVYSGGLN